MILLELRRGTETRSFSVTNNRPAGWVLHEQSNCETVRTVRFNDWHRVERAIDLIRQDVAALELEGWKPSGRWQIAGVGTGYSTNR